MEFTLKDAIEAISEYLEESAREGYQLRKLGKYNRNSREDKAVRKVDVLNQQLKHGKISKEDFDKKTHEIINKDGFDKSIGMKRQWLDKQGSKAETDQLVQRPNKEKSLMKKEDFFNHGNDSYFDAKDIDPVTQEKIYRHMAFMRNTDDEAEYKQHRLALLKLMGVTDKKTLKNAVIAPQYVTKKKVYGRLSGTDEKKPISKEDQEKEFVHTSPQKGLTKLTPTMRSRDGVFYPEKSVYFSKGEAISNKGFKDNKSHQYVYTGKKREGAQEDPELRGGNAVVVKTKDALPVKQVK